MKINQRWSEAGVLADHYQAGLYDDGTDTPTWRQGRIALFLEGLILAAICKAKGHDIEMEGWANTETGGEEWSCRRGCGFEGGHTYY